MIWIVAIALVIGAIHWLPQIRYKIKKSRRKRQLDAAVESLQQAEHLLGANQLTEATRILHELPDEIFVNTDYWGHCRALKIHARHHNNDKQLCTELIAHIERTGSYRDAQYVHRLIILGSVRGDAESFGKYLCGMLMGLDEETKREYFNAFINHLLDIWNRDDPLLFIPPSELDSVQQLAAAKSWLAYARSVVSWSGWNLFHSNSLARFLEAFGRARHVVAANNKHPHETDDVVFAALSIKNLNMTLSKPSEWASQMLSGYENLKVTDDPLSITKVLISYPSDDDAVYRAAQAAMEAHLVRQDRRSCLLRYEEAVECIGESLDLQRVLDLAEWVIEHQVTIGVTDSTGELCRRIERRLLAFPESITKCQHLLMFAISLSKIGLTAIAREIAGRTRAYVLSNSSPGLIEQTLYYSLAARNRGLFSDTPA